LLDWHDSLYGEPLEVDFVAHLRAIQKFAGIDELRAQLARDLAATRAAVPTP